MIAQFTEIFNNFEKLCETDPLLAAAIITIAIVCVSAAAVGLKI